MPNSSYAAWRGVCQGLGLLQWNAGGTVQAQLFMFLENVLVLGLYTVFVDNIAKLFLLKEQKKRHQK